MLASKVRSAHEVEEIRSALGELELVAVLWDEAIERGEREGRAPLHVDPTAPGVAAPRALGERLAGV